MADIFPFEQFTKLDIRVGRIRDAKQVEGSKKLLILKIDLGTEVRQAVSGIAEYYKPEELKGKLVAVVTNLPPRKIFGVESQVMILAATTNNSVAYLKPDKEVPEGSKVT
ncbi:MAG: methionine--tRNA ligase subunit beta [Conexivisphaerales archaeon]